MNRFLYLIATDQLNGVSVLFVKLLLWILSLAYRFFMALRGVFYRIGLLKTHRLPCSVISVGNLTVGGTGKTPLIEFLAEVLRNRNIKIVILMRGYMGGGVGSKVHASDEATILMNAFPDIPVLIGANRVKSAQTYLEHNSADVFLLDDGFQHQRLFRDVDIVVIDSTDPWGNGYVLPRGVLRESKHALTRAQIFVLTKTDFGKNNLDAITRDLGSRNPEALIVETIHKPVALVDIRLDAVVDLEMISRKQVCAMCSIGDPNSFVQTLSGLQANIGKRHPFMDHHIYTQEDIGRIVRSCQGQEITTIVTTEKDAVKLKPFLEEFPEKIQIYSLRIRIVVTAGEDQFLERIDRIL